MAITLEQIKQMLESAVGFQGKVAYRAFPENEAPALPYICFLAEKSNNFAADGTVYLPITAVSIELYTRVKDPQSEAAVEAVLAPFFWNKTEIFIDSENCYQITYEIEV